MAVRKDLTKGDLFRKDDITKEEFATMVVGGEMSGFSEEWSLNASLLDQADVYGEIADFIGHAEGDAAVELGCGSGELMRAIRPWNPEMALVGIDMNPHLLEVAESRASPGEKTVRQAEYSLSEVSGRGIIMQPVYRGLRPEKGASCLMLDDIRGMSLVSMSLRDSGITPAVFTLVFPGGGAHLELEHEWYRPDDQKMVRMATDMMYISAMKNAARMLPSGGKLVLGETFSRGSDDVVQVFQRMNEGYCDNSYRVEATRNLCRDRIRAYQKLYSGMGERFSRVMPSFRDGEYFVLVKLEKK